MQKARHNRGDAKERCGCVKSEVSRQKTDGQALVLNSQEAGGQALLRWMRSAALSHWKQRDAVESLERCLRNSGPQHVVELKQHVLLSHHDLHMHWPLGLACGDLQKRTSRRRLLMRLD